MSATAPERDVHVVLRGVDKRFGGVHALRAVDLEIERGAIHGLVGENGAGKSTLAKIVSGVHRPDDGELWVDGRRVSYSSPRDALRDGLTIITQEPTLVPHRSVLENVFLGLESSTPAWWSVESCAAATQSWWSGPTSSCPRTRTRARSGWPTSRRSRSSARSRATRT